MTKIYNKVKYHLRVIKRYFQSHIFDYTARYLLVGTIGRFRKYSVNTETVFKYASKVDLESLSHEQHGYNKPSLDYSIERLKVGDHLILGYRDDEIVFSSWLAYGNLELGNRYFVNISKNLVCSYRVHTIKEARGLGICPAYYSFIAKQFENSNIEQFVCNISRSNKASLRAHMKVGFSIIGISWELLVFGRRLYYLPPRLRRKLNR